MPAGATRPTLGIAFCGGAPGGSQPHGHSRCCAHLEEQGKCFRQAVRHRGQVDSQVIRPGEDGRCSGIDHRGGQRPTSGRDGEPVGSRAGREQAAGRLPPRRLERQADRDARGGAARNPCLAGRRDPSEGRRDRPGENRAGVEVAHRDAGGHLPGGHDAGLHGIQGDGRGAVAAVGPKLHGGVTDAHLREEVLEVRRSVRRRGDDGGLRGRRGATADSVELARVGSAERIGQQLEHLLVGARVAGDVVGIEEPALARPAPIPVTAKLHGRLLSQRGPHRPRSANDPDPEASGQSEKS